MSEAKVRYYLEKIEELAGYADLDLCFDFIEKACIADLEFIAELYGDGLSSGDYYALQEAVDRYRSGELYPEIDEDEDYELNKEEDGNA